MPTIANIGVQGKEKFSENALIKARKPAFPELTDDLDWYWTPGVSHGDTRKAKGAAGKYPAQRVAWVDCDESYDRKLLESLKPSYMWETSPGHTQAIWLLKDPLPLSEFHRDGFMGMLTHALGGDKSGVDVGQLLRVPGTWHHKRKPFHGRMLRSTGQVWTRGALLSRVARGLGFPAGLASELGAEDPYGDRSKLLWKFARTAAELGLDQKLTFKLIKACAWNKWKDDPDRLKDDIANAYEQQPDKPKDPAQEQAKEALEDHEEDLEEEIKPWSMASVGDFGKVLRKPLKWVLPGIIAESACGLLVAPPKVGKTRVAIEMALGLSTGRRPLGVAVRKPVPIGFLSLEDGEYLFAERVAEGLDQSRARAKFHWDGHIVPDGAGLTWVPPEPLQLFTHFSSADLSDPADQQRFYETINEYGLRLVIIDTLSLAIGKANVSDQKDMYAILTPIKDIAKATGCAVMFIHHTRKRVFEKGESIQESILGATALHGWSDFIMSLAPPAEDDDLLRLGVQTKRGNHQHYLDTDLRIIKRPPMEED
jgi:hypothetical protein